MYLESAGWGAQTGKTTDRLRAAYDEYICQGKRKLLEVRGKDLLVKSVRSVSMVVGVLAGKVSNSM